MFIFPPFVFTAPEAEYVFPIFIEVRMSKTIPPLALYAFMLCIGAVCKCPMGLMSMHGKTSRRVATY
jgi:hypothetical protein